MKKRAITAIVCVAAILGASTATVVAQSQRFPDVPPDHYAYEAVEWAAEVEVTTGYTDGTFKPQRPLSKRHAVVFMERYYDEILQAEESADFTRGDMMVLLKTINDGTIGGTESAGTVRGEEAVGAQSAVPPLVLISNDTEAFITQENDFSRYIKENIIEQYEDRQPWLRDVWNHTNRFDFSYLLREGYGTATYYGNRADEGDIMQRSMAVAITAGPDHLSPVYNSTHIHELAHVYTNSNRIVANPAPIAAGHIYFSEISQGGDRRDCRPHELYAETVSTTIFGRHPTATNWSRCPMVPDKITVEAVKVVHQIFIKEQMPQWFYDTFYDSQGKPDHQAIWAAVLRIEDGGSQVAVINQLRYSFGGYCYDIGIGDTRGIITGWVDGGC